MIITVGCRVCKEAHDIKVREEDIAKYRNGAFAQLAFPYLSAGERELIISRTCEPCFDKIFGHEGGVEE